VSDEADSEANCAKVIGQEDISQRSAPSSREESIWRALQLLHASDSKAIAEEA